MAGGVRERGRREGGREGDKEEGRERGRCSYCGFSVSLLILIKY